MTDDGLQATLLFSRVESRPSGDLVNGAVIATS